MPADRVNPDSSPAAAGDPARDVPAAATDTRDRGARPGLLGQARQERPVERLAGQFAAAGLRVLPGHRFIAAPDPSLPLVLLRCVTAAERADCPISRLGMAEAGPPTAGRPQ